jgi:filamentous hemagglutinin family protein
MINSMLYFDSDTYENVFKSVFRHYLSNLYQGGFIMLVKRLKSVSIITALALALMPIRGYCLPEGESLAQGSATFDKSVADQYTVNQSSDRVIIDYSKFNIAQPETVTFNQPNASSIALNRVAAGNPSSILGTLTANGRIFLINPSGITFGPNSSVDTAGLLASTLSMTTTDLDFMKPATSSFAFAGTGTNAVMNQGMITAINKPGGFVALLGARVENAADASVIADTGTIALASGNAMTVSLDAANLINVVVSDPSSLSSGQVGVINNGALLAQAGKVIVNAQILNTIVNQAVNNSGIIQGQGINITGNGDIVISESSMIMASAGTGDASVDISTTGIAANISIDRAIISSDVEDAGGSKVTIRAGNYQELPSDDYDLIQHLDGNSLITISGSYIGSSIGSQDVNWRDSLVEIEAKNISIDTSWIDSRCYGSGQARLNISAGDYDYFQGTDGSRDKIFSGGDLRISESVLNAQVDGGLNGDFSCDYQLASISLEASTMLLDNAGITATRADSGYASIALSAGNYLYHFADDYNADSLQGGYIDILNGSYLQSEVSDGFGNAQVTIKAGKEVAEDGDEEGPKCITMEDSNIDANGFGTAVSSWILLRSGDYETSGLREDDEGLVPYETLFGDSISLRNSFIKSQSENASADLELWGKDIKLENSGVSAIVNGSGDAELDLYTNDYFDDQDGNIEAYGGSIDIFDGSSLLATTDSGDAEIFLETSSDPGESTPCFISIADSAVNALVDGDGHAAIYMYDETADFGILSDIASFLSLDDIGGPVGGPISITNSAIHAQAATGVEDSKTAMIYMASDDDISFDYSEISAEEYMGLAAIGLISGKSINLTNDAYVWATSQGSSALIGALAGNNIDALGGDFAVEAYDGVGAIGLAAINDVSANAYAYGTFDGLAYGLDFINGLVGAGDPTLSYSIDNSKFYLTSAILLGSVCGDITLGYQDADVVVAAALGLDAESGGGNIYNASSVYANYLGLVAAGDIGTSESPINMDVNMVSAYSFGSGDIYLNQENPEMPVELGVYLPVYQTNWVDYGDGEGDWVTDKTPFIEIGASIAANDGIVHVTSECDMIVNSILAPRGGVFLESRNGSIFAGHGWNPTVSQSTVDGLGEGASILIDALFDVSMDPEEISGFIGSMMMDSPVPPAEDAESTYWSPAMGGFILGSNLEPGANVWATGYSYFSTPNGTIGSDPGDTSDLKGAIKGIVTPGVSSELNARPGFDLVPESGYVLYQDSGDRIQIYPDPAITPFSLTNPVNPLQVNIQRLAGSKSAAPVRDATDSVPAFSPVAGLTLNYNTVYVPPAPPVKPSGPDLNPSSQLYAPLVKNYRAYYEILSGHRFNNVEPATPTTFFGYRPLTPTNMSAFDDLNLDIGAYDFISDNIKTKKPLSPYYGM